MLRIGSRLALLLAALAVHACVALGPAFVPAPPPGADRALVYVYREDAQAGSALGMTIAVDGQEAATLYRRGYTRFYVTPGKRSLAFAVPFGATRTYYADLPGGDTRYFRLRAVEGRSGVDIRVDPVFPEAGAREVVFYRFQEPVREHL